MKDSFAERLIGHPVVVVFEEASDLPSKLRSNPFAAFSGCAHSDSGYHSIKATGPTRKKAIEALVKKVANIHFDFVRDRAAGRCENCGSRKALQVHHVIYRSQGGTHEPSNLKALCMDCHGSAHKEVKGLKSQTEALK